MSEWHIFETRAEYEPWWFFEGWRATISKSDTFIDKDNALSYFLMRTEELFDRNKNRKAKTYSTLAFWKDEEKIFCEACDDDLQMYTGLILMNGTSIYEWKEEEYEETILKKIKVKPS
ncbi:DUF1033 family protein [Bacillus sp. 2205SS5-2]|uniref:DUF1033 family protein n=1 Tax=Bacillus sp. 2205SS5-2 TaxID=3109031 RepID=UPI0030074900